MIEHWPDNSVIVSESFDTSTALKIRDAVREGNAGVHAETRAQDEIGLRLFAIPAFQEFAEQIGARIAREMAVAP